MGFKHEAPLRGWKEILTFIGVNDYRTATKILIEKNSWNTRAIRLSSLRANTWKHLRTESDIVRLHGETREGQRRGPGICRKELAGGWSASRSTDLNRPTRVEKESNFIFQTRGDVGLSRAPPRLFLMRVSRSSNTPG